MLKRIIEQRERPSQLSDLISRVSITVIIFTGVADSKIEFSNPNFWTRVTDGSKRHGVSRHADVATVTCYPGDALLDDIGRSRVVANDDDQRANDSKQSSWSIFPDITINARCAALRRTFPRDSNVSTIRSRM